MGSGKTIMELLHIDIHYKYFSNNKIDPIYLFVSSMINILKDIFFNELKSNEFKKYGFDKNLYNIVDLVNSHLKAKKKYII